MNKKEFREIIENNTKNETFRCKSVCCAGDVISNNNTKETFSYMGENAKEKKIDYLWRHVKKDGAFMIGSKLYEIDA